MRLFHRLLLIGVLSVIGRPRLTLIVAGVVLALCAGLAAQKLDISTDQNKLFDPNVKFFQDFLRFNQKFPENEAIYVVIEARAPGRQPPVQRWTDFADALTQRLKQMPQYVKSVDAKVPVEELGSQGLLFDSPESVKKNFEDIKRFIPLVK